MSDIFTKFLDITTEVSREHPKTSTQYEALITGPSSHERSITPSEDHISSSDNPMTPNHGAALLGQGLNQNGNPTGDAFGGSPAMDGRAVQFHPLGSTTRQRATVLGTHFNHHQLASHQRGRPSLQLETISAGK